MYFRSQIQYMFMWNNTANENLFSGYFPGKPGMKNTCDFFEGFFTQFKIDYTKFGENGHSYLVNGSDVEICFQNTTEFPDSL